MSFFLHPTGSQYYCAPLVSTKYPVEIDGLILNNVLVFSFVYTSDFNPFWFFSRFLSLHFSALYSPLMLYCLSAWHSTYTSSQSYVIFCVIECLCSSDCWRIGISGYGWTPQRSSMKLSPPSFSETPLYFSMTDETQYFKITLSLSLCRQSSSPDRHAKSQSLTRYCSSQAPVCSSSTLSALKRNKSLRHY